MNSRQYTVSWSVLPLLLIGLSGCSKKLTTSATSGGDTVSGSVTLGPVANSKCVVKEVSETTGEEGVTLGEGESNSSGEFSIVIPKTKKPYAIVCSGGNYTDESTGSQVSLDATDSLELFKKSDTDKSVTHHAVSLASAMAAQEIRAKLKTMTISAAIEASNAAVATALGFSGIDIIGMKPRSLTASPTGLTASEVSALCETKKGELKAGLLAATLSQSIIDLSSSLSPKDGVKKILSAMKKLKNLNGLDSLNDELFAEDSDIISLRGIIENIESTKSTFVYSSKNHSGVASSCFEVNEYGTSAPKGGIPVPDGGQGGIPQEGPPQDVVPGPGDVPMP